MCLMNLEALESMQFNPIPIGLFRGHESIGGGGGADLEHTHTNLGN